MKHRDWIVSNHCSKCEHLSLRGGDWFCSHPSLGLLAKSMGYFDYCPRGFTFEKDMEEKRALVEPKIGEPSPQAKEAQIKAYRSACEKTT